MRPGSSLYKLVLGQDRTTFRVCIPTHGYYGIFTQHGLDEFSGRLERDGKVVEPNHESKEASGYQRWPIPVQPSLFARPSTWATTWGWAWSPKASKRLNNSLSCNPITVPKDRAISSIALCRLKNLPLC